MKIMQTYGAMAVGMPLASAVLASVGRGASTVRDFCKRVNFYQCGGRRLGVPGLLCAKTRFVSIAAIPHILFHMCRQIGFALRATTKRGGLPSGVPPLECRVAVLT